MRLPPTDLHFWSLSFREQRNENDLQLVNIEGKKKNNVCEEMPLTYMIRQTGSSIKRKPSAVWMPYPDYLANTDLVTTISFLGSIYVNQTQSEDGRILMFVHTKRQRLQQRQPFLDSNQCVCN